MTPPETVTREAFEELEAGHLRFRRELAEALHSPSVDPAVLIQMGGTWWQATQDASARADGFEETARLMHDERKRLHALASTVVGLFANGHPTHPGEPCRQPGHTAQRTIDGWRAELDKPVPDASVMGSSASGWRFALSPSRSQVAFYDPGNGPWFVPRLSGAGSFRGPSEMVGWTIFTPGGERILPTPKPVEEPAPQKVWTLESPADRENDPRVAVIDVGGSLWTPRDGGKYACTTTPSMLHRTWLRLLELGPLLAAEPFTLSPPVGWMNRVDDLLRYHMTPLEDQRALSTAFGHMLRSWVGDWAREHCPEDPPPEVWGLRSARAIEEDLGPGSADDSESAYPTLTVGTFPPGEHTTFIQRDSARFAWYLGGCEDCEWTTSGSESNVKVWTAEHEEEPDRPRTVDVITAPPVEVSTVGVSETSSELLVTGHEHAEWLSPDGRWAVHIVPADAEFAKARDAGLEALREHLEEVDTIYFDPDSPRSVTDVAIEYLKYHRESANKSQAVLTRIHSLVNTAGYSGVRGDLAETVGTVLGDLKYSKERLAEVARAVYPRPEGA